MPHSMREQRPVMLRWLTGFSILVAIGILAVGVVVMADLRRDTWRQAAVAAENLAVVLNQEMARNIALYDLSIQGARDAVLLPGLENVSAEIRQTAIFDRAATAEYLGSLLVLKPDGTIFADSTSIDPHKLYLGDRDYFIVHRDKPDAGLFISKPFLSRLRGGDPSVAISRRIDGPDGTFAGVVVGTLRLAYFESIFKHLNIGTGGSITLMRTDGQMIARNPAATPDQLARIYVNSSVIEHVQNEPTGQYTGTSVIDQVERLFTFQQIGTLPLVINIAIATEAIYAPWRKKAAVLGTMMGLLFAGNVGLSVLFRREMKYRLVAEAGLKASAAELSIIATTDALTGISNRRAFDAALSRAWRGAIRTQSPLALLMIDVDCFKLFNDRFGHPAGDVALRRVAACIEQCIRRPNDLASRYGGEEFVALLTDTEADGAMRTAERIRSTVTAMGLPHPGGPAGTISVSVGVAALHPQTGESESRLLALADAALFEAKRAGRNRVVLEHDDAVPAGLPDLWSGRGVPGSRSASS